MSKFGKVTNDLWNPVTLYTRFSSGGNVKSSQHWKQMHEF